MRGVPEGEKIRVAIADDSALIYSDNYREGWRRGFLGVGCEVCVFDIAKMRTSTRGRMSRYSAAGGWGKRLAASIVAWRPHLVWCHHGRAASDQAFLDALKKAGIHVAVYLCDEPYETGETAAYSPLFDSVFTMDQCTMDTHHRSRSGRHGVYYLPPCADTERFARRAYFIEAIKGGEARDFARSQTAFFLGNADLIPRREWLEPLERVLNGVDIRYFPHRQVKGRPVAKGHPHWIGTDEHAGLYSKCAVGLNVHRDPAITAECHRTRVRGRDPRRLPVPAGITLCQQMPAREGTGFWNDGNLPASHVNPRFFEMAACGTCVVSDDHRSELARMFPMAPRAQDPAHFMELVAHYMVHLDEAEAIGQACSELILKRHTYLHRACEVLIRLGFKESRVGALPSFLGEPQDWLSPQDSNELGAKSSSAPTGPSARWSPRYGMSLISQSGDPSVASSINAPPPW